MSLANKHTRNIFIGFLAGIIIGLLIRLLPPLPLINEWLVNGLFDTIGKLFIEAMKMMVVPIVLVSLICGTFSLSSGKSFASITLKTLLLYLLTTVIAISLGLAVAAAIGIGSHVDTNLSADNFTLNLDKSLTLKDQIIRLIPENPVRAMAEGNMLQLIIFALLFGVAIRLAGRRSEPLITFFNAANHALLRLIHLIMLAAPYAVFCLLAGTFAKLGFHLLVQLASYFFTVVGVLLGQFFLTYPFFLLVFARKNPFSFFSKLPALWLFAFSSSSSNASIPITLETAIEQLKIKNKIAAFVIPLGATINMDGTAIMQGVATVFIANLYHIDLSFYQFITIIITATLASIGTAGVPGVGMIMLAMVFKQVGLPLEGIGLILGIDRLLDMLRTALNVTGDCVVAYIVDKTHRSSTLTPQHQIPELSHKS